MKTHLHKHWPKYLAVPAAAAFLYFFTVFGQYNTMSESMAPTLEPGDRMLADYWAYDMTGPDESAKPKRGDIVVFRVPVRQDLTFLKRLVGLPGDTIQMKEGRLYINGTLVPRTPIRDVSYTDYRGIDRRVKEYEETLPNGVKHRIYEQTDGGMLDNTPLYVIPQGYYFMMGDNRDNSADSRDLVHMGFVKTADILGKVKYISFSLYACTPTEDAICPGGSAFSRFLTRLR